MIFDLFSKNLAVDLGTSSTLVYCQGKGVILNEPSMVAIKEKDGKKIPVAFGREAKSMLGRTPEGVNVIRPVRTGVIADFEIAGMLLQHVLGRASKEIGAMVKPKVIVGVPSGVTEVERRAVEESLAAAGARDVKLIEETMAAAIGCELPVTEATASMVVDIGGGTTDVAVISLNDIVCSVSLRVGGEAFDNAIINHLRRHHRLLIGEPTAELVKMTIGTAHGSYDDQRMEVRGRSLTTGFPFAVIVEAKEIRETLNEVVATIVAGIRQALESTPPELAGDIISSGIALAGGGSLLKGLDKRISEDLKLAVTIADNPAATVVEGAGKCLENPELYRNIILS